MMTIIISKIVCIFYESRFFQNVDLKLVCINIKINSYEKRKQIGINFFYNTNIFITITSPIEYNNWLHFQYYT